MALAATTTGDIGEVLVYNTQLTAAQRQAVETYLYDQWFGSGVGTSPNGILPNTTPVSISGGGVLDLNSGSDSIGSLSSSDATSQVTLESGTLTTGNDNTSTTFAGGISGVGGSLVKVGSGTQTLSGVNTYSGSTTIAAGTLWLSNQNAAQNSTVTMSGGSLVFDGAVGGAFTFGGLAATSAGPGYDIALQDGAANPVALTVGGNNANTAYAGVLSGGGSLTKVGSGTLTRSGNNAYTGSTTISGGAIALGSPNTLVNNTVTVNSANGLAFAAGITTPDDRRPGRQWQYRLAVGRCLARHPDHRR